MFVHQLSFYFLLCVFLVNTDLVWSKHTVFYSGASNGQTKDICRGCASFGHSCYGGHGKRSQITETDVSSQQFVDSNQEMSQQYPHKSDPILDDQFPNIPNYDSVGKLKTDVNILLRKLAKLSEEDQRLHMKYMNKYLNF